MKRLIALILIVAMLLVPAVALASDITGARYFSVVTVSNNSTAVDDVFATFTLGTQSLIDANFLSDNLTDCAMHDTAGTDTAFMPSVNATYPWCFYVNNIGEDAFRNYLLYTGGNADMAGHIRYFPATGGMTSGDNATLEFSDNFTIEQKGFVDTDNGTDKNLSYKVGAFSLYVSPTVSENITAAILEWSANFTEVRRPDGHDTCVIPSEAGAACPGHWQNVDDPGASDDAATQVNCIATGATTYTDIYTLQDTSINATSQIIQVQTTIRGEIIGAGQYRVGLKLGTDTTWGAMRTDAAWTSHDEVLARPGGGSWTVADLDDLWIMVYVVAGGAAGNGAYVTQCYITTTFQNPVETVSVTATGVVKGEHTVKVTEQPVLYFDGVDDVINCGSAPSLDNIFDGGGTVAFWFNPASDGEVNAARILAKYVHVGTWGWFVQLFGEAGGEVKIRFWQYFSGTWGYWETTATEIPIDTWTFVAVTYNADAVGNNPTITINATDKTVGDGLTEGSTPVGTRQSDAAQNLYIGDNSLSDHSMDGYIGEVWLYNRILTPLERQQQYNGVDVDNTGLMGYWELDEASGASAYDSSGEGNTGTITGAIWGSEILRLYVDNTLRDVDDGANVPDTSDNWTFIENGSMPYMESHQIWIDGVLRQHIEYEYDDTTFHDRSFYGLRFDGVDDLINCGSANSLDNLTAMTIIIWTNRNAGDLQAVITKNTVPNTNGWDLVLRSASSILFTVDYDGAAALARRGSTVVPVGVFSFVAVTWDGSATATNIHLFYNGVEEPSYVVTTDGVGNRVDDSGQTLRVGVHGNSSGDYTGIIDEILIYNRVLSPEEITYNYNAGVGRYQPYSTAGLVGWWHLEENGSATAIDSSGEGNDGTITGAIWVNGHVPKPIGTSGINDVTPTFRGASSDADVSAALASFSPIEEAQAPAWVLTVERDFWDTGNITATGVFTTTPAPTVAPGVDVIEAIAAASATPAQLPFTIISGFVIIAVSLTFSWFLAKHGSRNLWLKITIITVLMAFVVAVRVFDFWMVLFFLIMAIAVALFSRQRSEA